MQRWTAIRERYDPERGDEYVFCELDESDDGDYVRFDDASAEIARLRKALVWAVRNGANNGYDGDSWHAIWYAVKRSRQTRGGSPVKSTQYDGTDASLIETLCKLAEEEE